MSCHVFISIRTKFTTPGYTSRRSGLSRTATWVWGITHTANNGVLLPSGEREPTEEEIRWADIFRWDFSNFSNISFELLLWCRRCAGVTPMTNKMRGINPASNNRVIFSFRKSEPTEEQVQWAIFRLVAIELLNPWTIASPNWVVIRKCGLYGNIAECHYCNPLFIPGQITQI